VAKPHSPVISPPNGQSPNKNSNELKLFMIRQIAYAGVKSPHPRAV